MSDVKTVAFEVEDDFLAFGGIALFSGTSEEGEPLIGISHYNKLAPVEIIGLLQTTLDQYRYNFIDQGHSILEDEEDEEED